MRDTYRAFLDAHWKPADIDALEVWQVGHLIREAPGGEEMAVASFRARQRGEKLTPASPTTHPVHGDAVRAALATKRAEKAS